MREKGKVVRNLESLRALGIMGKIVLRLIIMFNCMLLYGRE